MTDAVPQSTAVPLSEGQRIVDTFVAPSKTFTDILRKSSWWGPLVILIVMGIVFSFAVQTKVGWVKVFENNIHQSPKQEEKFAQMPPDQLATTKAISAKVTAGFTYGYWVIVLIFTAVSSLLVWATVNFGFGGTAKYGQIYAVSMYASLVMNIKFILATIALFAGLAADSFLISNPVGTNIGFYLSSDAPKWLMTFCTHLDIFEIWSLILSVIGVAIVAKVKRGTAAVAVIGWWLLTVLALTGAALAQS
ncbi:YIP1 family protein [Acidobacterium sp. S8]|uniref:YIP1 family protein n=1 Tax=Acidobacterium sp. S8 TaxID=1641854 RepID=UPI00131DC4D0|nr:YIP1 family protein [Acidobacterium sp. S8]